MTKNNIKEIILFIIKSAIFLWIARCSRVEVFSTIDFISLLLFAVLNVIPSVILSGIAILFFKKLSLYLYIVFSYFVAKKLGLVKFIDKSSIWLVVLILVVYEISLTISFPININHESINLYLIHEWKRIILNILSNMKFGDGFIYTFIVYKIARFLVNKYPKLSFLKQFYFLKKLEDIITFKNIFVPIKNRLLNCFYKFINWWKKNFRWY